MIVVVRGHDRVAYWLDYLIRDGAETRVVGESSKRTHDNGGRRVWQATGDILIVRRCGLKVDRKGIDVWSLRGCQARM